MKDFKLERKQRFNKFAWLVAPLLMVAIFAAGGVSILMTHAASPLNGRYAFRAVTTSGPNSGLYITGQMEFLVTGGTTVNGGICGLSIAPSHCTTLSGTTDGVHVNLIIHHIAGYPDIHLLGTFQSSASHGGFTGFAGTFTVGSSSGHWEARQGTAVDVSGSYYLYALYTKGPLKGHTIHGTLSIVQDANGRLDGTFCPNHGVCENANGSDYTGGGYVYVYLSIGTGKSNLQLRGTLSGSHRLNGQFQIPNASNVLVEQGYWLAH